MALSRCVTPILLCLLLVLTLGTAGSAQSVRPPEAPAEAGSQTLEDILARQNGEGAARSARDLSTAMPAPDGLPLGTRGAASDSDLWQALRFGTADVSVSAGGPTARVIMQDGGMWWLQARRTIADYGGWLLLGLIVFLALIRIIFGRIKIHGGRSGQTILRFTDLERFGHWLLASSFLLLAFTGLFSIFGRNGLIPFLGKDAYSTLAIGSKWIHNNVSWAFMAGLVIIFIFWVGHNLPARGDLKWLLRGGGLLTGNHVPAKKFNAGQKLVFWAVILLGASVSVSGLSLIFPFEMPLFAKTFASLNWTGLPQLMGLDTLPEQMSAQEEMQYAQLWHAIVGFLMMAIIIAHIYIGSVGMEGAFEAMGDGDVDLNWARDHHALWVEEVMARKADPPAPPANDPAAPDPAPQA
ncbi:formate dehydrogenase subunit gamma [Oceanomicrobium pacificus]|uniref:Formate dehydrogenase subunit gamma n=1 Tax=Oceanomicrobium pacificus TaxID=2692916 RepID=A0A6B0TR79_9RHOB|nr:formate dehydrogenase subunit gamma [Oceanomicrobium pacificus]MXU66456.1 formate dehydrogenase subunit gamma [Oceanomicrobium pacificus]